MLNIQLNEKEKTVIFSPDGALSEDDFKKAKEKIDPFIEKVGKLSGLIIYTDSFPNWDSFSALLRHLKFIKNHHEKVNSVAFVTNSIIGKISEHITAHFIKAEVKHFKFNQLEEAKKWIAKRSLIRHGLSLGVERVNSDYLLRFKAIGTLTHQDYETINPIIDSALQSVTYEKVNLLVDISEFDGWELHAAWDDMKLGLKYGKKFNKLAIYGENALVEYGIKITSWFMTGEVKEFKDINDAYKWLEEV